jgi:hypothetical protein
MERSHHERTSANGTAGRRHQHRPAGRACGGDSTETAPVIDPGDNGDHSVELDPADFTTLIDNPLLPLLPGSQWVYEDGEGERTEVTVTDRTRLVMGIEAVVVADQVFEDGELIEDTEDWFAQDTEGNVWYLGEETAEYEDGEIVSTEGAWEAGVDGALPGIVMQADPQPGQAYRQEYYAGEAEDMAEVVRLDGAASVPAGAYTDVVVIKEWTPLEPDVVEEKYYATGIGPVLEETVTGGSERNELLEHSGS